MFYCNFIAISHLWWIGHVAWMSDDCIPKALFLENWQLANVRLVHHASTTKTQSSDGGTPSDLAVSALRGPNSCDQRTTTYKEGTRVTSTAQSTTRHCRRISLWSIWKKLSLQNWIIQPHKMVYHAKDTMKTDLSYQQPNRRRRRLQLVHVQNKIK